MEAWQILLVAIVYIGILFAVAIAGDHHLDKKSPVPAALVYSLALAVYCTSWTYYGAVGRAASSGWDYLPIYLGPVLVYLFGAPMLRKILLAAKRQNSSSIADFISSRYGKRHGIAILVTFIATLAVVPYIALQLKAVTSSIEILTRYQFDGTGLLTDTTLLSAFSMIVFAILFGTRQVDVTEHHRGMMMAIAFESVVKLVALVTVGLFVVFVFFDGAKDFYGTFVNTPAIAEVFEPRFELNFFTQMLLSIGAILCLPRQFHIAVVENTHEQHLNLARKIFPIYLTVVCLVIVPVTSAGLLLFPDGLVDADSFVLNIPIATGNTWLTLLVFLGGFSAATAMIVVATLSLSTMLSNDVILPTLLRFRHAKIQSNTNLSPVLILVRRLAIAAIILMGYGYHRAYAGNEALTTIGLTAFSLVVQLTPALIGGIYWKRGNAYGVYAGLLVGFLIWWITLMLPTLIRGGMFSEEILISGLFGQPWLQPESLFGITAFDPLSHGVILSLGANIACYIGLSKLTSTRLIDRLQASAFVDLTDPRKQASELGFRRQQVTVSDMIALLERFSGTRHTDRLIAEFEAAQGFKLNQGATPKLQFIRYVERVLSGIIGSSSARAMVHSVLSGKQLGIEDVVTFFDETTQAIQFNQKLISTTLENIDQGVSVVDKDLRLVAWNRRYTELYQYPDGFLRIGRPVEELVRFNAQTGECGPGDIEAHVHRRMEHLRKGTSHRFIRVRQNGTVLEMKGNPLPGGGFVTTFNDITEHVNAQEALKEAKEQLEIRVEERTHTIQEINQELRAEIVHREEVQKELLAATEVAKQANASKTRFLALASHDILQPLNAARLYNATLMEDGLEDMSPPERNGVLSKLNESLQSTEELISTLLEIARLDDGAMAPKTEDFDLAEVMRPLKDEFTIIAQEKGLALHWVSTHARVHSDVVYLRRIVQNLVSNALKYTPAGKVLVGVRRQGAHVVIQVWDTGTGIAPEDQSRIFNDFYRIQTNTSGVNGVGLGLGVVARLSTLLGHPVELKSWCRTNQPTGSCFQVRVPVATAEPVRLPVESETASKPLLNPLNAVSVLCVDNEQENLDALETLLKRWGCEVHLASNREQALAIEQPDLILMDFQLDRGDSGISVTQALRQQWQYQVPAILITANADPGIRQMASQAGMSFLRKPIKPAPLRTLMVNLLRQQDKRVV